jgi:hypothetical protein
MIKYQVLNGSKYQVARRICPQVGVVPPGFSFPNSRHVCRKEGSVPDIYTSIEFKHKSNSKVDKNKF